MKELARITNLWSKVHLCDNQQISRVVIESTRPLYYQLKRFNQKVINLTVYHAVANMYCNTMEVYDGLIDEIAVQPGGEKCVFVYITLNYNAPCKIHTLDGIPARTFLCFKRSHLYDIFSGRKIIVDPGHGGNDTGEHGPVDLLEKNVVLTMSRQLKEQLEQVGSKIFLTRDSDIQIPLWQRFNLAKENKADLFLSFHTHYSKDSIVSGLSVNYNPACSESSRLAGIICEELTKKIKRNILGVKAEKDLYALGNIPAIIVKPVTISNWVEEGLLRNPTLYEKIALGIFNGLRRYFTSSMK